MVVVPGLVVVVVNAVVADIVVVVVIVVTIVVVAVVVAVVARVVLAQSLVHILVPTNGSALARVCERATLRISQRSFASTTLQKSQRQWQPLRNALCRRRTV